jgi:putative tricarboxylic transport membrane protein
VPVVVQNIVNPKGLWGHLVYISQQKGGNEGYYLSTIAGGNTLRAIRLDTRPYTIKDLKGVITTHSDTVVLVVKKNAKWKTLKEFLDDARVNPGKIRVVAGGPASGADYIVISLLEAAAGVKLAKIPSGGSGKGTLVLLGGGSEAASLSISGPAAYLKSGELRGIAIAMPTKERDSAWPDIPTYKEQGIDVGFPFANGLAVPKEVPDSHVKWLSELFKKAAQTEAFKKYVNAKGLSVHLRFLKETEQDMQAAINILDPILDEMGMKFKP